MTHAKPIPMPITALYPNDVQFDDKKIPFKIVKCILQENFNDIVSYHLFCLVLNYCETFKQNNICYNCSF